MSRKSERLVNLTIALLATKRLLTKSEIFARVEGYDGDVDARDRMFERDKDELRSIGITIEIGQIDPFFEDEVGYRITQSSYRLQIDNLSSQELTLIALAQQFFAGHALSDSAQDALIKFKSSGVPVDDSLVASSSFYQLAIPAVVTNIIRAIAEKRTITFDYINQNFIAESRTIAPFHLSYRFNKWYLQGLDSDLNEHRTFRIDRINSDVILSKKSDLFSIPQTVNLNFMQETEKVTINVLQGFHPVWLKDAELLEVHDEWSTYSVDLPMGDEGIEEILRAGTHVKVLAPLHMRESIIGALAEVVKRHG